MIQPGMEVRESKTENTGLMTSGVCCKGRARFNDMVVSLIPS